jgi:hypothetical protein
MGKISDAIAEAEASSRPYIAFEFYPPRTAEGVNNLTKRFDRMLLQSAFAGAPGLRSPARKSMWRFDGASSATATAGTRPIEGRSRKIRIEGRANGRVHEVFSPCALRGVLQSRCMPTSRGARAAPRRS